MGASVLVTTEINHSRQFLRTPPTVPDGLGGHVMPHVFIDAENRDAIETGLVRIRHLKEGTDRLPHRPPARAKLSAKPVDRGMLATKLPDRPPACTGSQFGAWQRDRLVLFHERTHRTRRFRRYPTAFQTTHIDRAAPPRRLHQ